MSLAASEAILQAAASHTKAFGLPRVRRRDVWQVEHAGSAGGEAFDDDEPDWEGGRARERKGLKWNKMSKTGFDAVVRRVPRMCFGPTRASRRLRRLRLQQLPAPGNIWC